MEKEKKKSFLMIALGIIALVGVVGGVTYAFFNYTRSTTANTLKTGRVYFNTEVYGSTINLETIFPISRTAAATDSVNAGTVAIDVTGDTESTSGIEYLVTATNVINSLDNNRLPISLIIEYSANGVQNTIGTPSETYFTARNSSENSIYKVLRTKITNDNDQVLVGYIGEGNTGINGRITIKAFIDSDDILVSDTYDADEGPNDYYGTDLSLGENKVVLTTDEWNDFQSQGISFKLKVEAKLGIWVSEQPTNIIYRAPGATVTPSTKEIVSTATQYGALATATLNLPSKVALFKGWYTQDTGGSRVLADTAYVSGTSATTLYAQWQDICPGCVYRYSTDPVYAKWDQTHTPSVLGPSDYSTSYQAVISDSGYNHFLGLVLDGDNKIARLFACGMYLDEVSNISRPFCLEMDQDNGATNTGLQLYNIGIIEDETLWGVESSQCTTDGSLYTCYGHHDDNLNTYLSSGVNYNYSFGQIETEDDANDYCRVSKSGEAVCYHGTGN